MERNYEEERKDLEIKEKGLNHRAELDAKTRIEVATIEAKSKVKVATITAGIGGGVLLVGTVVLIAAEAKGLPIGNMMKKILPFTKIPK